MMQRAALAALALAASACMTAPAVGTFTQLRLETRQECASHCQALGMRLTSVVLVRDSAGCVCSEPGTAPAADAGGATVNAGAYVVAVEEEQRRAQEEAARRHQQSSGQSSGAGSGASGWHR